MSERRLFMTDDLELLLPPGFVDKSAQLLEWPVEGGLVGLGIQRDCSKKRPSAEQLATKMKAEYERRLSQFVVEEVPEELRAQGHPLLAMRWRRDGQSVFQMQAFVEHVDRLLVITASGEARLRDMIIEVMSSTLGNLAFREPDA